jgi:hypothetical protein
MKMLKFKNPKININVLWKRKYLGILCVLFLMISISPSLAESSNMVLNSGFESGTASWYFHTDGAGTFKNDVSGPASPHAGHVTISSPGTNVQISQAGLSLRPNTLYTLKFKAKSNTGHDVSVSLLKHGSPYSNYGLNREVNLGTSWQETSIQFTTSGFSGQVNDARLMFYLAPYDAANDQYFFDDVTITEVSSGTPPSDPPSSGNPSSLLSNAGFESGTTSWFFFTNGAGTLKNDVSGPASSHAGHITISNPGSNVQLSQVMQLEANTVYKLDFRAYSNTGNDIEVSVLKNSAPYTNYGLNKYFNLGTTWGTYSVQFTTSGFSGTASDSRFMFWMAPYDASGVQYFIDDVVLTKVSSGSPSPSPSPAPSPSPTSPPPPPPSPPSPSPSSSGLVLLDVTWTHSATPINTPVWGSGKAFTFFSVPSAVPSNLISPVDYAHGTLYQRLIVYSKPSTKTVQYQICIFQDEIISSKHACSDRSKLRFTAPGTYYASEPMTSLYQYGVIDWSRRTLVDMLTIADGNGNLVDDRYGFAGKWDGSPNFGLYYPMSVRYTAIVVAPGGGSPW